MVKLDIMSDPICPWCYIGLTHLQTALQAHPDHPFEIEWHPFQLNPDMPAAGMDRRVYLEEKFGGKDNAAKAYAPVAEHAQAAGLQINFEAMQRTPNTLNAHRLIHWAGLEGKQTGMVWALFEAYFVAARDIGDTDTLVSIAHDAGMQETAVQRLLASDADRDTIQTRDAHARRMGVQSVPTFIIANQYAVPGAQQPDLWENILAELGDVI